MSQKTSIGIIKEYVKLLGCSLMSTSYRNNKEALKWKCDCGEEWESSWSNLKTKNALCPKCQNRRTSKNPNKYNINDFKIIANNKGGVCLSDIYTHCKVKLKFRCNFGHIWEATPANIINSKTWCPVCGRTSSTTINDMQKLAHKKNGMCLSTKYVNGSTKLLWECENGHEWMAVPESIVAGTWCPICANRNIPSTICEMHEIAHERDGECVSEKYVNAHSKLKWKCENGHEWNATPSNIKNGKWCPLCISSGGEKFLRNLFIKNGVKFESQKKYDDCRNVKQLPFDFYLIDYNILIEYDGHHHFKPIQFNGCSIEKANKTFLGTIKNDKIKNEYCMNNNIPLIRIPYTEKNIGEYLKNKLIDYNALFIIK